MQSIQTVVNSLHTSAQTQPTVNQLLIINPAGAVVAAIGNLTYNGVLYVNWLSELHAGAPLDPKNPNDAIFNCNLDGSCSIGDNGWFDVHDEFNGNAAWIGTQNDTVTITNAVNNGSGAVRLIVPGHTLATGNSATVRAMNLANVPNANGTWPVTVIDANNVDLNGSIWSGPFQSPAAASGLPTSQPTIDRVLQITNVTNDSGLFKITTSVPHGYESGSQVNIPSPGPMGVPTSAGQWIISVPATLAITGAVNNGSGLIRLTIPGGNYKTGDKVQVLLVGGVPNANGRWTATAISPGVIDLQGSTFAGVYTSGGTATFTNANTFDLDNSTFAGAYVSGGTVLEYFAGMLAESFAIGSSFANYKLRAFANGDLVLNNATITLNSTSGGILLDPTTPAIILTSNTTLAKIIIDASVPDIVFYNSSGVQSMVLNSNGTITANNINVNGLTSVGGTAPNQITLTIAGGLLAIVGSGTSAGAGTITIDGLMTAAGYAVGATLGITDTVSISGLALNFTKGLYISQSGAFATVGFTGTLAAAIAAGKNVTNGLIDS